MIRIISIVAFSFFQISVAFTQSPASQIGPHEPTTNAENRGGIVASPPTIDPIFNGFPLSHILRDGLIANSRTPIFEAIGNLPELMETRLEFEKQYSDPSKSQNETYLEFYRKFQSLAKGTSPGRIMGYVRPGFLLKSLNQKTDSTAATAFVKPIGNTDFACIPPSNFSSIGPKPIRKWWGEVDPLSQLDCETKFVPYLPTPHTLLFDPFEADEGILSNSAGEMRNVWLIESPKRNNMSPAVVETSGGLFVGYLVEKDTLAASELTWEQAKKVNNSAFQIKQKRKQDLKKGSLIFELFAKDKRIQSRVPSSNPVHFVLPNGLEKEIITKGVWALKSNIGIPTDSGFEPTELSVDTTGQFEIEKKLDSISFLFDASDSTVIRGIVVSENEKREVQKRGKNLPPLVKPWRKQKEELAVEIPLGLDGAIRFTDGISIYEVIPNKSKGADLITYTVE